MTNPHADLIARMQNSMHDDMLAEDHALWLKTITALSAPMTLAQAMTCPEVRALVGAAKEVWDQACENHDKPPPVKYMAPYGGLAKLHSSLAPFFALSANNERKPNAD